MGTMSLSRKMEGHTSDVLCLDVDPTNRKHGLIASGSCDATVKLWDSRLANAVLTIESHGPHDVNRVKWLPGSEYVIASGCDDSTVSLHDIRAGALCTYGDEKSGCGGVYGIDFSHCGRMLFAGYENGMLVCWDSLTGEILQQCDNQQKRVTALKTTPDGLAIGVADWEGRLTVWST